MADNPLQAYEEMMEKLRRGDNAQALAISRRLLETLRGDLLSIRNPLAAAAQETPDNALLHQRVWEIDAMVGLHPAYFSEAGQDRFIEETFFDGRTGGVFVEIGGHDGITGSNTLFFEKFRGWRGICLEASPGLYGKMTAARAAECLNTALADFEGEAPFFEITEGLHQMSGLTAELAPEFLKRARERDDVQGREITVPVTTFATLARARELNAVDYFSIDVEGAEIKVLQGIDFDDTDVRVFSVENPPADEANHRRIRAFMEDRGYRFVAAIGADEIFARD